VTHFWTLKYFVAAWPTEAKCSQQMGSTILGGGALLTILAISAAMGDVINLPYTSARATQHLATTTDNKLKLSPWRPAMYTAQWSIEYEAASGGPSASADVVVT